MSSPWCEDARRQRISFKNNFCTMVLNDFILNHYYGKTEQGKISCSDNSVALHATYNIHLKDIDPTRIKKRT